MNHTVHDAFMERAQKHGSQHKQTGLQLLEPRAKRPSHLEGGSGAQGSRTVGQEEDLVQCCPN